MRWWGIHSNQCEGPTIRSNIADLLAEGGSAAAHVESGAIAFDGEGNHLSDPDTASTCSGNAPDDIYFE